jgi:hypothetical protein
MLREQRKMSMQNIMDSPMRYQQQINFGVPTALNTDTVFADADTAINFLNPRANNMILDIKHTADPAAGLLYTLFVRRQQLSRTRIGTTQDFLVGFNGRIRPNMPKAIMGGFFQWVEQQNLGALTAQNYLVLYAQPLAV